MASLFSKALGKAQYEALPGSTNEIESDTTSESQVLPPKRGRASIGPLSRLLVTANVVLFLFLVFALFHAYQKNEGIDRNERFKKVSLYSPLLDAVEISMTTEMSFAQYGDGGPTIWRAPPSPEVDEAWDRVIPEHIWPVSHEEIIRMRKDPNVVAKLPPEYGEDAYVGKALAFHMIHCLNSIRKALHKDYYYADGEPYGGLFDLHTGHCIQVLMEHLMCTPAPGIYLYRWMDGFPMPIADTNIWSQCWDFESFLEQHNAMAITNISELDLQKPETAKVVPAPSFIIETLANATKKESDIEGSL